MEIERNCKGQAEGTRVIEIAGKLSVSGDVSLSLLLFMYVCVCLYISFSLTKAVSPYEGVEGAWEPNVNANFITLLDVRLYPLR